MNHTSKVGSKGGYYLPLVGLNASQELIDLWGTNSGGPAKHKNNSRHGRTPAEPKSGPRGPKEELSGEDVFTSKEFPLQMETHL